VAPATPVVTVASSLNPSVYSTNVVFTAGITPATLSGEITFKVDGVVLGIATLAGGSASLASSAIPGGTHQVTAVYGGSANYASVASAPLAQVVEKAIVPMSLRSSANPSTYSYNVTFTATFATNNLTGTLALLDGLVLKDWLAGQNLPQVGATPDWAAVQQWLQAQGLADLPAVLPLLPPGSVMTSGPVNGAAGAVTTSALSVGVHSMLAVYSGNGNYRENISGVFTQTVNKIKPFVLVGSSANPANYGDTVEFTAMVYPATVSGTVTFKDGATVLGTGTLANGMAMLAVNNLPGGTRLITATYPGSDIYAEVTSLPLPQEIAPAGEPPVANNDALEVYRNNAGSVAAAALLANDTNPAGGTLAVTGVSATSAKGGTVALANGTVTYTPPKNYVGTDSFTYAITDIRSYTVTGVVNVTVNDSQMIPLVYGPVVVGGNIVLRWAGAPGMTYTIEYMGSADGDWEKRANLEAPVLAGNLELGVIEYSEPPTAVSGFYRAVYPAY
jgi:hypothetical protein